MPSPQWIKPVWIALVEILKRIEQEPYHWPIGRTAFQKIAYIAILEGLPTGLHYRKGRFGPFSPELKGIITRLVNNGLIHEEHLMCMFVVKVGATFEDAHKAYLDDLRKWDSIIEKIADLFMRMNTSRSEFVATVLFAADTLSEEKNERPPETEVLDEIMQWKQRRCPPLDKDEVVYTIRNLTAFKMSECQTQP